MKRQLYFIALVCLAVIYSCKKNHATKEKTYRFHATITIDGLDRTYTLNLPPNYYDAADFSLIIAMHGGGGNASQFESTSKLTDKANAAKFVVVYPEGVQSAGVLKARSWNAGGCCAYAVEQNINDVKFISALIDKLVSTYKINAKKVYATGHSNGGMMAYRLACEIPNKIAAIAANGSTMVTESCNPTRPVAILHMHSVLDENIPYQGGIGNGPGTQGLSFSSVNSVLNTWSSSNACATTAQVVIDDDKYKLTKWTGCSGNASIEYYLTKDGGHAWPGGLPGSVIGDTPSKVISANDLVWGFFQQHHLP